MCTDNISYNTILCLFIVIVYFLQYLRFWIQLSWKDFKLRVWRSGKKVVINLFRKDISNFVTLSVLPTPFINSSVPDMHFRFQLSWEPWESRSNYCWNIYERENRLSLFKELDKYERCKLELVNQGVKLIGHCASWWNRIT